ncbi:NAD(P)-dependent oxidoreductase [Iamia sp. SCSIO 61187]|uniref:NAD(P)-dependent oxidoreductase n=1 Tax=Iamia sp. SCSIO 61187 TaxID=2722752 RepID=UPI001C626EC1|nr:NAD(P)-binding domain-containing protein [Iamia sp. SCSIO 61187]QYG91928.1 NAD(P)-dependent oxidoreductase [Iamia sp. SCSIO 61187]
MAPPPVPVTVLGLGPMGRALARALLTAGHPTTVWNRTPGRAGALVARGAAEATRAADAVAASPVVLVCVIDAAATRAIVDAAGPALQGRVLVNMTADTPDRSRELAARVLALGGTHLDAAIMTPTPTIGTDAASILYSGDEAAYATHRAVLDALGPATFVGADPGRAASYEVALLDLWWSSIAAAVHAFALARAEGVSAGDLEPHAAGITALLGETLTELATGIDAGEHDGSEADLASAAAGIDHVVEATASRGLHPGPAGAARELTRRAVAAGRGNDGLSALAEVMAIGSDADLVSTDGRAGR